MTLSKNALIKWEESMRIPISKKQRIAILQRFGSEPEPYEWSEQDISVQIQNFLGCGEFVKSIKDSDQQLSLPPGVPF
jgi:hypothetical protein